MMSVLAASPSLSLSDSPLEHLLLGDLRQLLEESACPVTSQWIVATLDHLLAGRPRSGSPFLPTLSRSLPWTHDEPPHSHQKLALFAKLQRLRDRVAHRAPYALLANEIRCDLREWFEAP